MRKYFNFTKTVGTNTAVAANKLIDSNASFISGPFPVNPGDEVYNEVTGQMARVLSVTATELELDSHIFQESGVPYRVRAGYVYLQGTTTSVQTNKLIDSAANFIRSGVKPGFIVQIQDQQATVISVDSENVLTIRPHIANQTGLSYEIYPGEVIFVESVQDIMDFVPILMAADSTEVTLTSSGTFKQFSFFNLDSQHIKVKELIVALEAKGNGKIEVYLNNTKKAEQIINSSNYSVFVLSFATGLSGDVVALFELKGDIQSGNSVSVRLLEVYGRRAV